MIIFFIFTVKSKNRTIEEIQNRTFECVCIHYPLTLKELIDLHLQNNIDYFFVFNFVLSI